MAATKAAEPSSRIGFAAHPSPGGVLQWAPPGISAAPARLLTAVRRRARLSPCKRTACSSSVPASPVPPWRRRDFHCSVGRWCRGVTSRPSCYTPAFLADAKPSHVWRFPAQHQPILGAPLLARPSLPVPLLIHIAGVRASSVLPFLIREAMVMKQKFGSNLSGSCRSQEMPSLTVSGRRPRLLISGRASFGLQFSILSPRSTACRRYRGWAGTETPSIGTNSSRSVMSSTTNPGFPSRSRTVARTPAGTRDG